MAGTRGPGMMNHAPAAAWLFPRWMAIASLGYHRGMAGTRGPGMMNHAPAVRLGFLRLIAIASLGYHRGMAVVCILERA